MKTANIVILAGQSNAVGVGYTHYLSKHFPPEKVEKYNSGYENVRIHYYSHNNRSDEFTPVRTGNAVAAVTTFGPEVGMAEAFTEYYPGEEIFIVKCACGCMSLHRDFRSPSGGAPYDKDAFADQKPDILDAHSHGEEIRAGWCYNELVKITRESIEMLENAGYTPKIRGFCWMQGEADAEDREYVSQYGNLYDCMLHDFTETFGGYMERCLFADGAVSQRWAFHRELNAVKAEYAASHENCVYIDTIGAGLTTAHEPEGDPDTAHYDADSVIRLGRMFAETVQW
ncbi:MAG: hypothetical protein IJ325_05915 [Clostridia bacterium]|nr:hypothetical protein [Clostridia bacterium]